MYNRSYFKEQDSERVIEFMRNHPFIILAGADKEGRIEATQVPVMIEEKEGRVYLTGHLEKKSGHHKAFEENPGAIALFTGPHSYVSATWYSGNPHQASTWNYITVHARGVIKFLNDDRLTEHLKQLSLYYEKDDPGSSTVYDNLPAEYVERLKKAIIAFEIEITELENVFKLSQNRDEKSYDNIVAELKKQDADAKVIGEMMEERKEKLFK